VTLPEDVAYADALYVLRQLASIWPAGVVSPGSNRMPQLAKLFTTGFVPDIDIVYAQAARTPSTRLSHSRTWFQLVKVRVTG
jgi:hypothetical protein